MEEVILGVNLVVEEIVVEEVEVVVVIKKL